MLRIIHTFQYYNKTFRAGDLTVEDFWLYLRDPESAIEKILTEFNEKAPKMSVDHFKKFMDILFNTKEGDDERKKKMLEKTAQQKDSKKIREERSEYEKDFHIEIGEMCIILKQQYESVLKMPLWLYERNKSDLAIFTGKEKYMSGRHKKTIDSAGLKKALKK